jgi:hypothetical protein
MKTSQLDLKIRTGKTRRQVKIRLRRDNATFLLDIDPGDRGRWADAAIDESRKRFSISDLCRAHQQLELILQVLVQYLHNADRTKPVPPEFGQLFETLKTLTYVEPASKSRHRTKH